MVGVRPPQCIGFQCQRQAPTPGANSAAGSPSQVGFDRRRARRQREIGRQAHARQRHHVQKKLTHPNPTALFEDLFETIQADWAVLRLIYAYSTTCSQSTPISASNSRNSGIESPITLLGSPSIPATNGDESPSRVKLPATASGSPVRT